MWTRWSNLCVKLNCFLNLKYLLTRWLFCKMYLSQFKIFTKCKPGETIYGGKKDVCWSNHKRASAANGCEYLVSIEHFCLLCLWFSKISITTFYFLPWIKRTSWVKANLANKTVSNKWILKYWISKTGWRGVSLTQWSETNHWNCFDCLSLSFSFRPILQSRHIWVETFWIWVKMLLHRLFFARFTKGGWVPFPTLISIWWWWWLVWE